MSRQIQQHMRTECIEHDVREADKPPPEFPTPLTKVIGIFLFF